MGQVYAQTAVNVGKTHLKKGCNHSSGGDVMPGQDEACGYGFLHGSEGSDKSGRIRHRRNFASQPAHSLRQRRAAQLDSV